jgi:hypothetical protein
MIGVTVQRMLESMLVTGIIGTAPEKKLWFLLITASFMLNLIR